MVYSRLQSSAPRCAPTGEVPWYHSARYFKSTRSPLFGAEADHRREFRTTGRCIVYVDCMFVWGNIYLNNKIKKKQFSAGSSPWLLIQLISLKHI